MSELIWIITATLGMILIAILSGAVYLANKRLTNKTLPYLVALAAGTLLGGAFLHLIPESFEETHTLVPVIVGLLVFFVLESLVHWHHHHTAPCEDCDHPHGAQPLALTSLAGGTLHNILDGMIIAIGFLAGIEIGIATTLAIFLHAIPQEIGDIAILMKGNFSRKKAILYNLASSSAAIVGGVGTFLFLSNASVLVAPLLGFTAGGFLYIALADLFPEFHKEHAPKRKLLQFLLIIAGILIIGLLLGGQAH